MAEEVKETAVYLSAPWVTYFKMVYNVLGGDPEINMPVEITLEKDGVYSFYIESSNSTKIIALSKVLRNTIQMGNITINVDFRCTDNTVAIKPETDEVTVQDYDDAFVGNKFFVKTESIKSPMGVFEYAIFSRDIITFFNDDISDYHCNAHYIVADIIKEIANDSPVMPCTYYEAEDADAEAAE